jgi:hypothetical protein
MEGVGWHSPRASDSARLQRLPDLRNGCRAAHPMQFTKSTVTIYLNDIHVWPFWALTRQGYLQ